MTIMVPIMLFGWIPLSVLLFFALKPHHAVLFIVIGGVLLLPQAEFVFQGLPNYSKSTAIAIGLILGGRLSGQRRASGFKWKVYDIPVVVFCVVALFSSVYNGLGVYDGFSKTLKNILFLAIPYLAGRFYFTSEHSIRDLCLGIVIGGLFYVPLCLFEVRMSPQLSNILYGFMPHSFIQHVRYGGYRPIVFMSHGLMVALWMAFSSMLAFWLWRSGSLRSLAAVPMSVLTGALAATTVLCKSANGWVVLLAGCLSYYLIGIWRNKLIYCFLILLAAYPALRITGAVSARQVESIASIFFDQERVDSLRIRLLQEDLFIERTLGKKFFGWGGSRQGWPIDDYGNLAVPMIDPMWLIFFNAGGLIGLISLFWIMLQGPLMHIRASNTAEQCRDDKDLPFLVLSLVALFFVLDSLFNSMPNSVYFLVFGALVSSGLHKRIDKEYQ